MILRKGEIGLACHELKGCLKGQIMQKIKVA
jgi:hypothetical protein